MQKYSSKNTSVNSVLLPAVYNKVNLSDLRKDCKKSFPIILDYGCGKNTDHVMDFCNHEFCLWRGYDPHNKSYAENIFALSSKPDIIVCSNVLNVIDEDDEILKIHILLRSFNKPYFITVYEGNKSGVGRKTKEDCWQRNQRLSKYKFRDEITYKGVLTKPEYVKYIK